MNNEEKIKQLESEIKYLTQDYKKEKKRVAYLESGLGMRELELENKQKELNQLRDALHEGGEN